MFSGVDLKYMGGKAQDFIINDDEIANSAKFRYAYANIGALILRIQLGQAQRATLLQHVSREDFKDNPSHTVGEGGNQTNIFSIPETASTTCQTTKELEQFSHYPIGRGKLLNERTQPQKSRNTKDLRGEEYLWDVLHSPVWSIGLNLSAQLTKQGFYYLCSTPEFTASEYDQITQELHQGKFKKIDAQNIVRVNSGTMLKIARIQDLEISLDAEQKITSQNNGFVISHMGNCAPLGWMMHDDGIRNHSIGAQYTEDLLRIIRIAKGGTHKLPKKEYNLLIENMRGTNDNVTLTQNRSLNLLDVVVQTLESQYQFDATKLLGTSIQNSYDTIQERMKNSDVIEDFLTGILISEMVQHLKITLPQSSRLNLPRSLENSFDTTLNSAKAFAYAFDLKKPNGSLVFIANEEPISEPDNDLIDVRLNGDLQEPDLTNPKHISALLSTGLLVAEQMLIEQLLKTACMQSDEHPYAVALLQLLNKETYEKLILLANQLPSNIEGPILGLQIPACEEIVTLLRASLGFDRLAALAKELYYANSSGSVSTTLQPELITLFKVGTILQQLNGISVIKECSRGINAGIVPVIKHLAPEAYSELIKTTEIAPLKIKKNIPTERNKHHSVNNQASLTSCPYLNKSTSYSKEVKNTNSNTWCNFFMKKALPIAVVTTAVTLSAVAAMSK